MPITYLAVKVSPNVSRDPTSGFIICSNVPICRSGFQEYLGAELIKHADYDAAWNLDPEETYKVYRPKSEVSSPETIASFEGKPVVDNHPPSWLVPGSILSLDDAAEYARGHAQRLHIGDEVDDGEISIAADLHIIDRELADKIFIQGIRDISCGYIFHLRMVDGRLEMFEIRGNHVAVVPKGRAGHEVAISDAAPSRMTKEIHSMTLKERAMLLRTEGWKALWAKDPDKAAAMSSAMDAELEEKEGGETEAEKKAKADKATKDAAEKAAKDAELEKGPHYKAAHDCVDRLFEAHASDSKMGKDAFGQDADIPALIKELTSYFKEEEGEAAHQDAAPPGLETLDADETEEEKKAREEKERKEKEEKAAKDGEVIEADKVNETGKEAVKSTMDSAKTLYDSLRPQVCVILRKPAAKRSTADRAMVDSCNNAARLYKAAKKNMQVAASATDNDPYAAFATVVIPDRARATSDSATQAKEEPDFFNGVPYQTGLARRNEWLRSQEKK
jgi:hypothetical protein